MQLPFLLTVAASALAATAATAADYYVAPSGSDTNPGSLAQPFLTIQRAANLMVAGDTCHLRAGTYRETVTPARSGSAASPITFCPYGSEVATVSGADVVTGWSVYSGGIYHAAFTGSLGDQDQVFVDGAMMNLARWPNTSLDVSRPTKATAATGAYGTTLNADGTSTGVYTDPALTQPAGFFHGARICLLPGAQWLAQTGTVTSNAPGAVQFHWFSSGAPTLPQAGDPYFLFGLLSLLDTPGEWFIDTTAKQLYLWPPQNDSPTNHTVEAKQRAYGFNLANRAYIIVQGLQLFACAVNTSSISRNLVLDGLQCRYVSHFSLINTASAWTYHMEDTGLILNGTENILRNSVIAFSAGNGVTILGTSNLVDNCVIHDVDYGELDCAAINSGNTGDLSNGHEIRNNTCYNSGRGLLLLRALTRGYIHNNVLYRSMLRTQDGGAMYTWGRDGQNTVIAYDRVSDNVCGGGGSGIYLDNNSTNFITHHNLIYNTSFALHYNLNSVNMKWFNNTAVGISQSFMGGFSGTQTNSEVQNNIFTALFTIATTNAAEVVVSNNLTNTVNPLFVSTNALDFRLQSNSPAVAAGIPIPPYTDGYNGAAPDLGAFEYGQTPWTAGSTLTKAPPAGPTNLGGSAAGAAIQLTWNDNAANETQYVLDRSLDGQLYTELAHLPANTTNYTDFTVQKGLTYYYRVRADESLNSNYQTVTIPGHDAFATIPAWLLDAQSGLTVWVGGIGSCDNNDWAEYAGTDFGSGATNISLFLANGQTLTNLFIEVRLDRTNGTRIADINVLGTGGWGNYTNLSSPVSAVSGVHDLYFVFKGGYGVCNLQYFSFGAVVPVPVPPIPQALAATGIATNQVRLTWALINAGPSGFKLERSTDYQNFLEIGTAAAATNSFTDTGLASGTTYYYRSRTYNKLGFSAYSTIAAAATWTPIQAWRYQYFGTIADTGDAADNAAPEADGLVNLIKYALGRNPTVPDAPGAFTGQVNPAGQLQVSFLRARAELTYTVQASSDLTTWTNFITNPGAVGQNVIVTDDPPLGSTQRFLRLLVSLP